MAKNILSFLDPPKTRSRIHVVRKEVWKTNPAMAIVPTIIVFFSFVGISYALSWQISKVMAGAVSAAAGILYILAALVFSQMKQTKKRRVKARKRR